MNPRGDSIGELLGNVETQNGIPTAKSGITEFWSAPGTKEVIFCAATFLAYVGTLAFGFVYDDQPQIVTNPAIHAWSYLPRYFTSHVWNDIYSGQVGNYYRPLFLLWLRLNHAAWGLTPQWWHLTAVLCHVLVTYLVFRLAQSLTGDRSTAFLAGLLFGLHPAHIESVAWISGVTDTLMAIFFLASLCAYLRYRDEKKKLWLCATVGAFVLALLTKETAIVLPLLIAVYEWPGEHDAKISMGATVGRLATALTPFLAVAAVYLLVRNSALGGFTPMSMSMSWKVAVLTWPSVALFYVRHLLWPFGLSGFYPSPLLAQISGRAILGSLALVLLAVACTWGLVRWLGWSRSTRCAVALLVLPTLPALYSPALPARDMLHDRYLYLPLAGFAILLAMALERLAAAGSRGVLIRWAVAGLLVTGYLAGTLTQQLQWASDRRLYTKGIESAPDNIVVRDNLADALLAAGEFDRAFPLCVEVLRRDPNYWRANYHLAFLYYKTGHYAEAEKYFTRAIQIDPTDADEFINLGVVQIHEGRLDEALSNTRHAIQLSPKAMGYHLILGMMLKAKGLPRDAANEFRLELMHNPGNEKAAQALREIEQEK